MRITERGWGVIFVLALLAFFLLAPTETPLPNLGSSPAIFSTTLEVIMSTSSTAVFLRADAPEPELGAVILLEGPAGTAYQRLHLTGRWHSTTTGAVNTEGLSWSQLQYKTTRRGAFPVLLIHDPTTCRVGYPEDEALAAPSTVQGGVEPPA